MRNKLFSAVLCPVMIFLLSLAYVPLKAECSSHTVDEIRSLIDGIVDYKLNEAGAASVDEWLNGSIASGAGTTSDWYAVTLSQCGYRDLDAYEKALKEHIESNNVVSATTREKYAIALCAAGSNSSYIYDILDSSVGEQGMMSWIYGLHILNNGYTCSKYNTDSVVDTILSMQNDDGGWALFGDYGDIDVTAMTVQALAPYYCQNEDVTAAVDNALEFLSLRQKENGGYESFGTPNPESASQVLTALSALGIDCRNDERFIKNGNNLIDGIVIYHLPDGSFCHSIDGGTNETATVQAYYSLVAFVRMTEGKSPLLILDNRRISDTNNTSVNQAEHESSSANQAETTRVIVTVSSYNDNTLTTKSSEAASVRTVITSSAISGTVVSQNGTTVSSTLKTTVISPHNTPKGGYKPKAVLIIICSAAVISLIIFIIGKRNYKNYLFLVIIAGIGIAFVLITDISSAKQYYNGEKKQKSNIIGTVSLEIRCDTIAGRSDSDNIPADGVILAPTAFDIEQGDTVFDILNEAAQTYGIHVENKGSSGNAHGMVYIAGINYIYEYDFGDLSGWVYHVNGITPSRSCGEYELSDGDRIEWLYTCEIGHDLNEVYEK